MHRCHVAACVTANAPSSSSAQLVLEPVTLPILNKPLVPGVGVVLPNSMSFPIATNFGLPPPPPGAIKVRQGPWGACCGGHLACRPGATRRLLPLLRLLLQNPPCC